MIKPYSSTIRRLTAAFSCIMLFCVMTTGVKASPGSIDANPYKAFHDTYDESDPDQKFLDALALKFYNVELDIMVDTDHSTYSGAQYPDYLQGQVKLYVKHDAASWPNTRHLYQYFEDIAEQVARNSGSVHGDGKSIIINLDMKTANRPDYSEVSSSLQAIFEHYGDMLSYSLLEDHQSFNEGVITVCLSGAEELKNTYYDHIASSTKKLFAFRDKVYSVTDSRFSNVADYFPKEADNYHRFYAVHWKHIESGFDLLMPGNWSHEEEKRLEEMMALASQKGYTLRFYSLNGNEGAWHYKFPNGDGEAAQRWTQFAYANDKLGTRHFVSTDSYLAMTRLYDHFLVPLRDYNHRVEKTGGTQNGQDASVSITDDGRVIEIHKAEGIFNHNLWYSVGSIQPDGYIRWTTNERINPGGSNKNGIQPHSDVTKINNQYVVLQVNQTDGSGSGLWANIGRLEPNNTVTWMTNEKIAIGGQHTEGEWPHIALDGNKVVLSYSKGGKLFYHTGLLHPAEYRIEWMTQGTINDQNGERPDVDLRNGNIIVVYTSGGKLRYTTGNWAGSGQVTWSVSGSMQDQSGRTPTVVFLGDDKLIELHTSENTGLIWYNIGELQWPNIHWIHNNIWDSGTSSNPSVDYSADSNVLIDIHKAAANDALWYNTGRIND